jgi:hypothetical protein
LTEALLIGSIQQLQQDYGLASSPTLSLERQLGAGATR